MYICHELERIRPEGKVTCKLFHGRQVVSRKMRLEVEGFYPLPGELWNPIDKGDAINLALKSLCYHLDSEKKLLDKEQVLTLVTAFLAVFSESSVFSTNYDGSFECISHSFLDIAILIENKSGVTGLLCVEDSNS